MSKTRTFVAIDLEDDLRRRAAAVASRLQPYAPNARWVEEENLHATLLFLGDLTDQELSDVCSQAEWAARANAPFEMRLCGAGAFPDLSRPKALWLGVTDGAEPLSRLHADLDDALCELVPRSENRRFIPHVTLARLSGGGRSGRRSASAAPSHLGDVMRGLADYDAGTQLVTEVTVYSSVLRREGPEYHAMAHCPMGMPG